MAAIAGPRTPGSENHATTNDFDFAGRPMPDIKQALVTGDRKLSSRVRAIAKALVLDLAPTEPCFSTYFDVSGSEPDIGRYLDGTPECMLEFEPDKRLVSTVSIGVNITASCSRASESLETRGANIAALIDYLEEQNIRVELVVYTNNSNKIHHSLVVKTYDQPLDLDKIAVVLGDVATYRRIFFSLWEHGPEALIYDIATTGYGISCTEPPPDYAFDILFANGNAAVDADDIVEYAKAYLTPTEPDERR